MPKGTPKKTRFAFRTTQELKKRIAAAAESLNLSEAIVGEAALEAVVSYVEKHGELTIPIRIERHEKKEEEATLSEPGSRELPSARRSSSPPTAPKTSK